MEGIHLTTNQLLLAAIVVSVIAAPIETLAQDKSVVQKVMPAAVRLPIEGELPRLAVRLGGLIRRH